MNMGSVTETIGSGDCLNGKMTGAGNLNKMARSLRHEYYRTHVPCRFRKYLNGNIEGPGKAVSLVGTESNYKRAPDEPENMTDGHSSLHINDIGPPSAESISSHNQWSINNLQVNPNNALVSNKPLVLRLLAANINEGKAPSSDHTKMNKRNSTALKSSSPKPTRFEISSLRSNIRDPLFVSSATSSEVSVAASRSALKSSSPRNMKILHDFSTPEIPSGDSQSFWARRLHQTAAGETDKARTVDKTMVNNIVCNSVIGGKSNAYYSGSNANDAFWSIRTVGTLSQKEPLKGSIAKGLCSRCRRSGIDEEHIGFSKEFSAKEFVMPKPNYLSRSTAPQIRRRSADKIRTLMPTLQSDEDLVSLRGKNHKLNTSFATSDTIKYPYFAFFAKRDNPAKAAGIMPDEMTCSPAGMKKPFVASGKRSPSDTDIKKLTTFMNSESGISRYKATADRAKSNNECKRFSTCISTIRNVEFHNKSWSFDCSGPPKEVCFKSYSDFRRSREDSALSNSYATQPRTLFEDCDAEPSRTPLLEGLDSEEDPGVATNPLSPSSTNTSNQVFPVTKPVENCLQEKEHLQKQLCLTMLGVSSGLESSDGKKQRGFIKPLAAASTAAITMHIKRLRSGRDQNDALRRKLWDVRDYADFFQFVATVSDPCGKETVMCYVRPATAIKPFELSAYKAVELRRAAKNYEKHLTANNWS